MKIYIKKLIIVLCIVALGVLPVFINRSESIFYNRPNFSGPYLTSSFFAYYLGYIGFGVIISMVEYKSKSVKTKYLIPLLIIALIFANIDIINHMWIQSLFLVKWTTLELVNFSRVSFGYLFYSSLVMKGEKAND